MGHNGAQVNPLDVEWPEPGDGTVVPEREVICISCLVHKPTTAWTWDDVMPVSCGCLIGRRCSATLLSCARLHGGTANDPCVVLAASERGMEEQLASLSFMFEPTTAPRVEEALGIHSAGARLVADWFVENKLPSPYTTHDLQDLVRRIDAALDDENSGS